METPLRQWFNAVFTPDRYEAFLKSIHSDFPGKLDFRVAETPLFLPDDFTAKCIHAGERIIDFLVRPDFKALTEAAIPPHLATPGEDDCPRLLSIDFAVSRGEDGRLVPYLIELQGFATLFNYQAYLAGQYRAHYSIPDTLSSYFGGLNQDTYLQLLKQTLLGDTPPEETVLLELFPEKQKTRIDFALAKRDFGIEAVCLTKLVRQGKDLFYKKEGRLQKISRVYNRVILDELASYRDLQLPFSFREEVNLTWVAHPNWFFRISKYLLPFLEGPAVPRSCLLSQFPETSGDLTDYVLKPLYSFAGSGVILQPDAAQIASIKDKDHYLLQRRITYEPVVASPTGMVKAELRLMYLWREEESRPRLVTNIARLSRGEMIGVRYNHSFDWVGGSVAFSQKGLK